MTHAPRLLSPDPVAMIARGVSTLVASCDAALRPSLMRALGCTITDDGTRITVFLARSQSRQLLQDLAAGSGIAVVFSQPSTHRTVQVKARRIDGVRAAADDDLPALDRYLRGMEAELAAVGFGAAFARVMLGFRLDDVVALTFTPTEAFDQTPGPQAGRPLGGGAGTGSAGHTTADAAMPSPPAPSLPSPLPSPLLPPSSSPSPSPTPALNAIRACLEGAIPGVMATCAPDGTPNVAYLSQVHYVDERHVALSFQFFNKTRRNILANPHGTVLVMHPATGAFYRLRLRYLRTESDGPLFERMKAQLAGIASHSGMAGVFKLLGADIYEVQAIEALESPALLPAPPCGVSLLSAVRQAAERLARCTATDELLQAALDALVGPMDVRHAMVLMLDAAAQRLYTVASRGYAASGVGSEIDVGDGVIGVAARERTLIRIGHMTSAASYSHAVRSGLSQADPALEFDGDIPFPGLAEPHSQLAAPIVSAGRLLGVLFVESPLDMRFGFDEEDAIATLAAHLGSALDLLREAAEPAEGSRAAAPSVTATPTPPVTPAAAAPTPEPGPPLDVRHYAANDSVFVDGRYLIKGVAGAIVWKLLRDHTTQGRIEFTNRELRLDPTIGLPDVADNLEARLVLLQRRLQESGPHLRIEKTGRGRFALRLGRPVVLTEMPC